MKKILMAATVALCFAGNAFAQDEIADGSEAAKNSDKSIATSTIAGGAVGIGVLAALAGSGSGTVKDSGGGGGGGGIECGPGEELVNDECVPVGSTNTNTVTNTASTNTVTSTVTGTNTVTSTVTGTNTVTSTMTTPVTVTASVTYL